MIRSGPLPSTTTEKRVGWKAAALAAGADAARAGVGAARLAIRLAVTAAVSRILRNMSVLSNSVVRKNGFDRKLEEGGDAEGERQTGIVFAGLDRVHALPRDVEPVGEVAL